ncbi:MAG: hypothetical protein K6T30_08330 [Alicyclobacillus sp.]|nr:hypothetical protein [Alicyclobacillus sp.]
MRKRRSYAVDFVKRCVLCGVELKSETADPGRAMCRDCHSEYEEPERKMVELDE